MLRQCVRCDRTHAAALKGLHIAVTALQMKRLIVRRNKDFLYVDRNGSNIQNSHFQQSPLFDAAATYDLTPHQQ